MHLLIFSELFALLLGSIAPNYDPVLKGIPRLPEQTVVLTPSSFPLVPLFPHIPAPLASVSQYIFLILIFLPSTFLKNKTLCKMGTFSTAYINRALLGWQDQLKNCTLKAVSASVMINVWHILDPAFCSQGAWQRH